MAENYKQVSGDFQTPATEKEKAEETEIIVNEGVETNVNLPTIKDVKSLLKQSSGGSSGELSDVLIKYTNVALSSEGKATIIPTADEFATMCDEDKEVVVSIQFTSGAIVNLHRVSIANTSRVIFASQHSTTEYISDCTAVFIHVDGDGYYSGGVVVSTMLEANTVLDESTEYADLDNITVNGETYLIGGGIKLYRHYIHIEEDSDPGNNIVISLINLTQNALTLDTFTEEMIINCILAKVRDYNGTDADFYDFNRFDRMSFEFYFNENTVFQFSLSDAPQVSTFTDTVTEL